jgi:hypothetical protein
MHDPVNAQAATEARRLGGIRRRREGTLAGAYDIASVRDPDAIWRILDVALFDTLSLDTSIARNRLLVALAQVALKATELTEHEERLRALEVAIAGRRDTAVPSNVYDFDDAAPIPASLR